MSEMIQNLLSFFAAINCTAFRPSQNIENGGAKLDHGSAAKLAVRAA
ncbi:hypothetical protein LX82_03140 [Celeribacter halophilus]|uniref:Uncharacterized protein n=1 Tax=Celeribacter halophilus TaxID=576117 RepID=A0A1I3WB65_9RHOB|nr:hypothetical protein LX82_03140 [Celeribacter halophilus]SFK03666.1 hypothetical protein SAMN04488138_1222 [Celeribacter halophilus]